MKLIKKVFGYCQKCKRWFVYPKRRMMNTMYEDYESNFCYVCANCFDDIQKYWDAMWDDYYSSR